MARTCRGNPLQPPYRLTIMHSRLRLVSIAAVLGLSAGACASASNGLSTDHASSTEPSSSTTSVTVAATVPLGSIHGLLGIRWIVDSRITVGGAIPIGASSTAGFTIANDGTMTVDTGCNTGSGAVSFPNATTFQVSDLVLTEKACADEPGNVEAEMLTLLGTVLAWSTTNSQLTVYPLTITDVGLILHAAP